MKSSTVMIGGVLERVTVSLDLTSSRNKEVLVWQMS